MNLPKLRGIFRQLFSIEAKPDPKDANLTEAQVITIAKSAVEKKAWRWEGNSSVSLYSAGNETDQIIAIAKSSADEQDPNWLIAPNVIINIAEQDKNYLWWQVILNLDVFDSLRTIIDIDDNTGQAFAIYLEQ